MTPETKPSPPPPELPTATTLVNDILKGEISEIDKKSLAERRAYYNSLEGDTATFDSINQLRVTTEPIEEWKKIATEARKEISTLDPNVLEKLLAAFAPYIKNLPAGHGRGHFLRDSMNITLIMQDPAMSSYPPEEVFAGILGAEYHDIGISVVNRYEETKRFSAHAEVGADLFGKVAKGILPDNLLRLAQMSIAGHTHYTKDQAVIRDQESGAVIKSDNFEITEDNGNPIAVDSFSGTARFKDKASGQVTTKKIVKRVRKASTATIENGAQAGMWFARWSDRLDNRGIPHAVRHIITKASPTEDFDGEKYHKNDSDETITFKKQFEAVRNKENNNVLSHLEMFANTDKDPKIASEPNAYNKFDTPYMTAALFAPENQMQREFIRTVEDKADPTNPEWKPVTANLNDASKKAIINEGMEKFITLAQLMEPASDLSTQLDRLKIAFPVLGDTQINWMLGFKKMFDKMYPEYWGRKGEGLHQKPPTLAYTDPLITARMNELVGIHLYPIAKEVHAHLKQPAQTS